MKILQVGKYYPPQLGGMETVLENLTLGLLEDGHEVAVLVAGEGAGERREEIIHQGQTASLTRLANLGVLNSQPLTLDLVAALRRTLQRFQPDLVHLHLPNPLLAAAWLALGRLSPGPGLPPVAVWHHADITRQRLGRLLVGPVSRRLLRSARGICVSSRALAENSSDLQPWRAKVAVVPFGLAAQPWDQVHSTCDGPFLFVGRMVPYKGLEILLGAVAEVPGARAVLVGEGPLLGHLRQVTARDPALAGRVSLPGSLPRQAIVDIMGTCRALVLPSLDRSETFGLVQLEAMAAGLPVVASDLPTGVGEVGLPDRTCLLTPPGDRAALARALGALQADPELCRRLGAAGRRRFQQEFTRKRMTAALTGWYAQLLAGAD